MPYTTADRIAGLLRHTPAAARHQAPANPRPGLLDRLFRGKVAGGPSAPNARRLCSIEADQVQRFVHDLPQLQAVIDAWGGIDALTVDEYLMLRAVVRDAGQLGA